MNPPAAKRRITLRRVLEIVAVVGFWLCVAIWSWKWFQPIIRQAQELNER